MHLDERFHHGQTEAEPAPLVLEQPRGVSGDVEGREERLEHVRPAGHVDPDARIAHPDLSSPVRRATRREGDTPGIRRELDRVQQEVAQAVPDLLRFQLHGAEPPAVVADERLSSERHEGADVLGGVFEQAEEIDRFTLQRPLELLHREHGGEFVDAAPKPVGRAGDLQEPSVQGLRNVAGLGHQMGEETEDHDRRAQLVAGHPDEVGLELARLRQLGVGSDQLLIGVLQLAEQPLALRDQRAALHGVAHDSLQLFGVPRLGDVAVDVSPVDGVDHGADIGIAREEEAHRLRLGLAHMVEELDARHLRHALVGHDHVDRPRVENGHRLAGPRRYEDPVVEAQELPDALHHIRLVIDHQDACLPRLSHPPRPRPVE